MFAAIRIGRRYQVVALAILLTAAGGAGQSFAGTGVAAPVEVPITRAAERPSFSLERFVEGPDSALKEFGTARSDHAAVALYIGQCYPEFGDPLHWSPATRARLLFELDQHLMHTISYNASAEDAGALRDGTGAGPVLNPFHGAAISFSDRISRDRLEYRRELETHRSRSDDFYWAVVCLGAIATTLVSARTIFSGDHWAAKSVGILAIIASAAGTASSSISSFEGDHAAALRNQRALAQLQQLHWRVASDVLQKPDLCKDPKLPPGKAMDMVSAWRIRLEEIADSAQESISKPGDLSTGSTPEQYGTGAHDQGSNAASTQAAAAH